MINKTKMNELPRPLESFTRGLLATTCLTVACGVSATAGTITETPYSNPTPPEFPITPNGYLLPVGTTQVNGWVVGGENAYDPQFFEFQGLTPGASYTMTASSPENLPGVDNGLGLFVYNDTHAPLPVGGLSPSSASIGIIDLGEGACCNAPLPFVGPADGNVIVEAIDFGEQGYQSYTVNLTSGVPEPATGGIVGLGLGAIALAWRRRRAS